MNDKKINHTLNREQIKHYFFLLGYHILRDLFKYLGVIILVCWKYGWSGTITIPIYVIFSTCSFITRQKSDFWFLGFCFLMIAIYFANWFFNDIYKTVSIPLALLFYIIARKFLPNPINDVFDQIESRLTLRWPNRLKYNGIKYGQNDKKKRKTYFNAYPFYGRKDTQNTYDNHKRKIRRKIFNKTKYNR